MVAGVDLDDIIHILSVVEYVYFLCPIASVRICIFTTCLVCLATGGDGLFLLHR